MNQTCKVAREAKDGALVVDPAAAIKASTWFTQNPDAFDRYVEKMATDVLGAMDEFTRHRFVRDLLGRKPVKEHDE